MNAIKALKLTIITQWCFIIASVVVGLYEESYLPMELLSYVNGETEKEFTNFEIAIFSVSILMLFVLLYSSVAVYRLRSWARKPYTIILLTIVIAYLFVGVEVITPISASLDYFGTLATGVTLGLLYFSEARTIFESTSNK